MDKTSSWVAGIVALIVGLPVGAHAEDDPRTRTDIDAELAHQLYRESQPTRTQANVEYLPTRR